MESARLLEEKCREFAVAGSVVQIHPGPVVTTFEFKPEAGVKYSKITSLADDLSLAHAGRVGAHRTHARQVDRRHPDPQPAPRADLAARTARVGRLPGGAVEADAWRWARRSTASRSSATSRRCRTCSSPGATGTGKSVALNAMLDQHPLPGDAGRGAPDHDRSQAPRTRDVRGDPAPAHAGGGRPEAGGQRAHVGRPGDGGALQDAGRRGRAEHRPVQPQHPGGRARAAAPNSDEAAAEAPALHRRRHRRTRRPDDGGAQRGRGIRSPAWRRWPAPSASTCCSPRSGRRWTSSPASSRPTSRRASRSACRRRSTRAPSWTATAPSSCSGKGDMLFLPPASSRLVRVHGPYISEQETARLAAFLRKQGKPVYDESITAEEKGAGRDRVREGRPLRRGRAARRVDRPGVDLVPAAPAARRASAAPRAWST